MAETTVESKIRAELTDRLGGTRGSFETAAPILVFTVVYVVTRETTAAVATALVAAAGSFVVRLVQHSDTRFVRQGLLGIALAALVVWATGRPEDAFLPGLIQNAAWALLLGGSLVVRWPLGGFVIGAVIDDVKGWRAYPQLTRLADRLTLILLAPMLIRLAVQTPLYLAGEVGWLGVSRVLLGWPLHLATLALIGVALWRGRTPLPPNKTQ